MQSTVPGTDAPVRAMLAWDPDGGGPQPPVLVVGGDFHYVNGVAAAHVAYWDGLVWRPLGGGTQGPVFSLAVYNGKLVAGGTVASLSSQIPDIEYWTGSTWLAMKGDLAGTPDTVFSLVPYNGQLIAGGHFSNEAGTVHDIAAYDGTSWQPMGAGMNSAVRCLDVWNNALYAGGAFTLADTAHARYVARWDGAGWSRVSDGTSNGPTTPVMCMGAHGTDLFMGETYPAVNAVVRWTGTSWQSAGTLCAEVRSLVESGGILYAGGSFENAGGCTLDRIAAWTGSSWVDVGGGIDAGLGGADILVRALADLNGLLFAGGFFGQAGGVPANNVACWSGVSWQSPASQLTVYALGGYGSKVAVGGYFSKASAPDDYLVSWNGQQLAPLGAGIDAPAFALKGYTTTSGAHTYDNLLVGGAFTHAGGLAANHVAQWTETDVYPFDYWSALGSGFDNNVYALEQFMGSTVAGGAFISSGATVVSRVAQWNGASWQPMGSGMNGAVRAFKSYLVNFNTAGLVAGGDFTVANGSAANRVAIWTASTINLSYTPWTALGDGFNNSVYAIERYNGSTYAAGTFTASGNGGTPLDRIARWTGTTWVAVGSTPGGGFDGPVYALKAEGGYLYAAGSFTSADGVPALNVARWDGATWSAVDVGTDATAWALAAYNAEVLTGGSFDWAESSALPSPALARFLETGAPWLTAQPASQTIAQHQDVTFQATVAAGYDSIGFVWRKNGTPLVMGATGTGSTLSSTFFFGNVDLTIQSASMSDSGTYDCVVSNACGSVTSAPAVLVVNSSTGVPALSGEPRFDLVISPDPAPHGATLDFSLPRAGSARATLYDMQGRVVRRLLDGSFPAGAGRVEWDGRDERGATVGAGVYVVRFSSGGEVMVRKLVVMR